MKKKIIYFLLQPYPFYYEGKSLKIIAGLFFLMTFFFNYAFEPFHVDYSEHKMSFFWISIIHSITPVLIILFLSINIKVLKLYNKWIVGKEIFSIFLFFILVGIIQFLIRDVIYDNENNWSWNYLYEEVRNTFLVGTLFVIILIPINFNRLNTKHSKEAKKVNVFVQNNTSSVTIEQSIKINDFEFHINQFLFAKSEGNYVEIYLCESQDKKQLVRFTLKKLEILLKEYPNIIRTHRSYIVNRNHIEEIRGNAQGYQLQITTYKVPVSRNMIPDFDIKMKH